MWTVGVLGSVGILGMMGGEGEVGRMRVGKGMGRRVHVRVRV